MPRKAKEVDSDIDYFIDPLVLTKKDERSDITDGMPECTDDQFDDSSDMPTSVRSAQSMPEYDAEDAPQELICCVHGFPCESTTNSPSSQSDQYDKPSVASNVINISASKYGRNSRLKKQSYDPWTDPTNSELHPNLNASAASYPSDSNMEQLVTSVGSSFSSDSENSGENEPAANDYMVLGVNEQSPNLVTENPRRRRNKVKKVEQVEKKVDQTREQKGNSYLRYYLGPMTRSEAEKALCSSNFVLSLPSCSIAFEGLR
ncbi:hypothetical protein M3Y94_00870500 [Aphelenchoides besseyi]|nr:hypothetical protein M3Y94_00870500 [Aphelenchoides besseyi]